MKIVLSARHLLFLTRNSPSSTSTLAFFTAKASVELKQSSVGWKRRVSSWQWKSECRIEKSECRVEKASVELTIIKRASSWEKRVSSSEKRVSSWIVSNSLLVICRLATRFSNSKLDTQQKETLHLHKVLKYCENQYVRLYSHKTYYFT